MATEKEMLDAIRADEDAIVAEGDDRDSSRLTRRRRSAKRPAQVYSLRIPVDRLDQLRVVANERGVEPSALMREWVLERLDAEAAGRGTSPWIQGRLVVRRVETVAATTSGARWAQVREDAFA